MANAQRLEDVESQLYWCWDWYLLRVWQNCGSFESALPFDRLQIGEEMLSDAAGRNKEWASLGSAKLLDHLTLRLDDPDPLVRQEAAIGLGDHCRIDHQAADVLVERLQSVDHTLHDRACAAWALGRIRARPTLTIPVLQSSMEQVSELADAGGLRNNCAEAIENMTGELDVLLTVAHRCLQDQHWKCRMRGLYLASRLIKRQPELRGQFESLITHLISDELEEIREIARRLVMEYE